MSDAPLQPDAAPPAPSPAAPEEAPVASGDVLSFREAVATLWQTLCLWRIWFTLGRRDFVMRFKRMRLGVAWQFVTLCMLLLTIGFIYATLFKTNIRDFLVFLSASLIMWFYLVLSIDTGCLALIGSEGYIKQLPVPPLTYAFRSATANTLSLLLTAPAFFVIKFAFQPTFWWGMCWAAPGLLAFILTVALVGACLAFLNARIRDVQPAVTTLMQILFYVTPIIYMPSQLANSGKAFVYLYNPLFHVINVVRGPLLGTTELLSTSWAVTGGVLVLLVGLLLWIVARFSRRIVYYL